MPYSKKRKVDFWMRSQRRVLVASAAQKAISPNPNRILQGLEEVISLANAINRAHEDSVSIGKTLLAESSMWNPMHRIILETAKGDASMQSIIEDRGMPGTGGVRYGRASENDGR